MKARDGLFRNGLTLHHLEVFVSVTESGSMSAAAKRFGLSQPAVSQTIAKLEEASGVELFDRSMRPPVLTLRGSGFLKHAIEVIQSVQRLEGGLIDQDGQLPVLRIGMLNSFASTLGPFIIKTLQNTAAQWYVDTGYEASRLVALLNRSCDFVITANEAPPPPGLLVLPLLSEPYRAIVPKDFDTTSTTLRDELSRMSMIRFGRDPHMISRIENWLTASGVTSSTRYHLDTIEGAGQMVASGLGWSLLPPLASFRLIERGDAIKSIPFPGPPLRRTISVVARKDEGAVIAERIWSAASDLIASVFLPSLQKHTPDALDEVEVHGNRKRPRSRPR